MKQTITKLRNFNARELLDTANALVCARDQFDEDREEGTPEIRSEVLRLYDLAREVTSGGLGEGEECRVALEDLFSAADDLRDRVGSMIRHLEEALEPLETLAALEPESLGDEADA